MKISNSLLLGALAWLASGCSVLQAPTSWNAKPVVIDDKQAQFAAISAASNMGHLISAGNSLRTNVQSLISASRTNLDRASAGNYGFGLLGAAAALSNLHTDALVGTGFLGGTHVALSQRLSPRAYMQQLQQASDGFSCLTGVTQEFEDKKLKAVAIRQANASVMNVYSAIGYADDLDSHYQIAVGKAKHAFLRTLEVAQRKLDAQISLADPTEVRDGLVSKIKAAAKGAENVDRAVGGDPVMKEFLIKGEELDANLETCIAKL